MKKSFPSYLNCFERFSEKPVTFVEAIQDCFCWFRYITQNDYFDIYSD